MTEKEAFALAVAQQEANNLLQNYSAAFVVEWIGRYEFLIEQIEAYKQNPDRIPPHDLDPLIAHARKVLELLRAGCRAGRRI